jgi:hypothetical protein
MLILINGHDDTSVAINVTATSAYTRGKESIRPHNFSDALRDGTPEFLAILV